MERSFILGKTRFPTGEHFFSLEKSVESAGASFFRGKSKLTDETTVFFVKKRMESARACFFRWKMGGDSRARSFLRSAMQAFLTQTFFCPTEKSNERTVSSFLPCERTRLPGEDLRRRRDKIGFAVNQLALSAQHFLPIETRGRSDRRKPGIYPTEGKPQHGGNSWRMRYKEVRNQRES